MSLMKDIMVYTCEMWHQKKSVAEIIEKLSCDYPKVKFTERKVVDILIEYYPAIFEEEFQPQKDYLDEEKL